MVSRRCKYLVVEWSVSSTLQDSGAAPNQSPCTLVLVESCGEAPDDCSHKFAKEKKNVSKINKPKGLRQVLSRRQFLMQRWDVALYSPTFKKNMTETHQCFISVGFSSHPAISYFIGTAMIYIKRVNCPIQECGQLSENLMSRENS